MQEAVIDANASQARATLAFLRVGRFPFPRVDVIPRSDVRRPREKNKVQDSTKFGCVQRSEGLEKEQLVDSLPFSEVAVRGVRLTDGPSRRGSPASP